MKETHFEAALLGVGLGVLIVAAIFFCIHFGSPGLPSWSMTYLD